MPLEDLGLPALGLRVVQVHPQQVGREQRALGSALAALDLHDHVAAVVRVARDEQAPQLLLGRLEARGHAGDLLGEGLVLARHLGAAARSSLSCCHWWYAATIRLSSA